MTLFNIQTKYLTFKSKYDSSSRSKTWFSTSFNIPIYEATFLCIPVYSLQRELTFLVTCQLLSSYVHRLSESSLYVSCDALYDFG